MLATWVSKSLGFPVVAVPGICNMTAKGKDKQEAAQVFYAAALKAIQRLMIGMGGNGRVWRGLSA